MIGGDGINDESKKMSPAPEWRVDSVRKSGGFWSN